MNLTLNHIGIIIDGNRRWARAKGWPIWRGHQAGYDNLKKIAKHAFSRGIKILTIYAFSTENWKRDKKEVAFLLKLMELMLSKEIKEINEWGVKLKILGETNKFSPKLQRAIADGEKFTSHNKKGILNICLSYGGRQEIINAFKKFIKKEKGIASQLTEKNFSAYLYNADQPDPDLIIRTSGEMRLSNFLTWQSVYSELYFSKKYWPDFSTKDFDRVLAEYNKRQRRFGA